MLRFALFLTILLCSPVLARAAERTHRPISMGYLAPNIDLGLSVDQGFWLGAGLAGDHEVYYPSGLGLMGRGALSWDIFEGRAVGTASMGLGWFSSRLVARGYGVMTGSSSQTIGDYTVVHQWGNRLGHTRSPRIRGVYLAPRLSAFSKGQSESAALIPGAILAFRMINVDGPTWARHGRPEWGRTRRITAIRYDFGLYYENGGGALFNLLIVKRWFAFGLDLFVGSPLRMEEPLGVGWISSPETANVRD